MENLDDLKIENSEDMFQGIAKSSVKIKKTTRGITWDIKVVSGEENLLEELMLKAVEVHKKMIKELEDNK